MPSFRPFDSLFGRRQPRHAERAPLRDAIQTFQEVSVFQDLNRSALRELASAVHERMYRRDEFLYYERDPGLGLYIVQEGSVRLYKETENGAFHELGTVGPRDLIGTLSILGDCHRHETAQAAVDTQVLGFYRPDLATMLKRNPRAAAAILGALARYQAASQLALIELFEERVGPLEAGALSLAAGRRAMQTSGMPA